MVDGVVDGVMDGVTDGVILGVTVCVGVGEDGQTYVSPTGIQLPLVVITTSKFWSYQGIILEQMSTICCELIVCCVHVRLIQ